MTPSVEKPLISYLKAKVAKLNADLIELNNVEDHVHALVRLAPLHSISKFMKDLKGSSSHYVTKELGMDPAFQWQTGYGVFTVGQTELERISEYIRKQKEHHKAGTLVRELEGEVNWDSVA